MLNRIRLCLVAALVLAAGAIPLSLADQKIDDAIRRAKIAVCTNTFSACTNQCSTRASAAPGSYSFCMQDCTAQYQRCMGAISRGTTVSGSTGVTSRPSVAPPTPTPKKISPERVTGVTKTKDGPTASPGKSSTPRPEKLSRASATATPRKN